MDLLERSDCCFSGDRVCRLTLRGNAVESSAWLIDLGIIPWQKFMRPLFPERLSRRAAPRFHRCVNLMHLVSNCDGRTFARLVILQNSLAVPETGTGAELVVITGTSASHLFPS